MGLMSVQTEDAIQTLKLLLQSQLRSARPPKLLRKRQLKRAADVEVITDDLWRNERP
jgi:hypothetical protein